MEIRVHSEWIYICSISASDFLFEFFFFRAIALFSHSPTSVYSAFSLLQVYALEYGSLSSIGAIIYACSGCYVLASPGAGIAQSHIYVFEAIQKLCRTRCED